MHNRHGDIIKGKYKKELALCGAVSIFDALFTQYAELFPSGIQSYLYVADYNIVYIYIVTQCATELIGSNMNLTKPPVMITLKCSSGYHTTAQQYTRSTLKSMLMHGRGANTN